MRYDTTIKLNSLLLFILIFSTPVVYSQSTSAYYTAPPQNGFSNSKVFRQEIARFEVTVSRDGKPALPLTQVPRVEEGDILRVKLLEEAVGGTKPDQSNFDWTMVVTFVNPNRNDRDPRAVTEEIRFRDKGWYKEHIFRVPYDSQPIIFLYTKPKYRGKIANLIHKNPEDIRKLGEKTIEIAGAYAQIGSFLTELQDVISRTRYNAYNGGSSYGNYNGYGSSYGGNNSSYGKSSGSYGASYGNSVNYGASGSYGNQNRYTPAFNNSQFVEQTVERVAKSFNIQLPQCWRPGSFSGSSNAYGSASSYGNYSSSGSYGSGYGNSSSPQDLIGRMQCIAQSVRIEDLDISLSKMIQQGGVMVAAQIAQKYPQIAYWINMAAAAMDLIIRITRKSALKIVPTVVSASDSSAGYNSGYQTNSAAGNSTGQPQNSYSQGGFSNGSNPPSSKISVYAENQPGDDKFVTAYPVIVHKWQPEPDPEQLALSAPVPLESCLHAGQNILKNTDLSQDWLNDTFTRNFKLVVSSPNGFFKEFPLRKNAGLLGWDLNLTREDLAAFPKIGMSVDAEITGTRGFTELKSPKFPLPVSSTAKWEITPDSQKNFTVGGKRRIALINALGNCLCIQSIVYKPSFGGQFVFEANGSETGLQFSPDGREAWFSIDATEFKSGTGTLDLITYGGEKTAINLKAYPLLPKITDIRIAKGDREAIITGERLEQIQFVFINGIKAKVTPGSDPKEKIAVFEDLYARQTSETVAIEMLLEEDRRVKIPETFKASISRPMLIALDGREIEGDYILGTTSPSDSGASQGSDSAKVSQIYEGVAVKPVKTVASLPAKTQVDLTGLPVIPISASSVSAHVKNALTDYDFKAENIRIEARLEKGEADIQGLLKSSAEVLDWKNMRLSFEIDPQLQKLLGGRRLQFRIKDKARGNSDWYTVRQTFVRVPQIESVTCSASANGCQIKGEGIDYIAQVSVDGGQSWSPSDAGGLVAKVAPDGSKTATIPYLTNKNLFQLKLKDFSKTGGLTVLNYNFIKVQGGSRRTGQPNNLPANTNSVPPVSTKTP